MNNTWADYAEAFTIFATYNEGAHCTFADHDVIYIALLPSDTSDEDRERLDKLGWTENNGDGWKINT